MASFLWLVERPQAEAGAASVLRLWPQGRRLPFSSFTLDSERSSGFPYMNVEGGLIAQTAQLEDKWAPDICPAAVSPWFQTGKGERSGAFCFYLYCSRRHTQVHTKHTQAHTEHSLAELYLAFMSLCVCGGGQSGRLEFLRPHGDF